MSFKKYARDPQWHMLMDDGKQIEVTISGDGGSFEIRWSWATALRFANWLQDWHRERYPEVYKEEGTGPCPSGPKGDLGDPGILALSTDRIFHGSPDVGPECLCSRCNKPILTGVPLRAFLHESPGTEYRYHAECVRIVEVPEVDEEETAF